MIDALNSIDTSLFHFFNNFIANKLFDYIMPILTDLNQKPLVILIVFALLIILLIKGNYKTRISIIILIVTIIITDQLSSSIIKYLVEKPRPCHYLDNVRLLVNCGSGFSFPSSHAVNNFAGAFILTSFFPKYKWLFFIYASLVAFSRIYVGVHFPSDVIAGAAIGIICASLIMLSYLTIQNYFYKRLDIDRKK